MVNPLIKSTYYLVRPIIPLPVRWFFQRRVAKHINGFSTYPMWPLPELPPESLIANNNIKDNKNNPPLPSLILTHDVDTQFGFDHIRDVAEVEKRLGFKSSWNIVPDLYEIDESVLDYLRDSGMEIGVHDWNHDGRLFSDKKIFDERVKKINQVIKRWGAKGFRAGMVFHNDEWMQQLECEYDTSYYDTDPYQPMGGGCGKIRPFMLGHLVELPYTMPQDHTLFVAGAVVRLPLNYDDADVQRRSNWEWIRRYIERRNSYPQITQISADYFVSRKGAKARRLKTVSHRAHRGHREFKDADYLRGIDIWKMKAEWLVERGGMVLMITHPDYLCHPRLCAKSKDLYDGWLHSNDRDVQEVREKGIVEEMWYGSLLEQYAGFLNWFKREYKDMYWHCLANEVKGISHRHTQMDADEKEGEEGRR